MKWLIWKSERGWHAGKRRGTPLITNAEWEPIRAEVDAMIRWTREGR